MFEGIGWDFLFQAFAWGVVGVFSAVMGLLAVLEMFPGKERIGGWSRAIVPIRRRGESRGAGSPGIRHRMAGEEGGWARFSGGIRGGRGALPRRGRIRREGGGPVRGGDG